MAGGLSQFSAEFTDYLDRSGLDRSLIQRHYLRVYGCLVVAAAVLAGNLGGVGSGSASAAARNLLIWISLVSVNLCTLGLLHSRTIGVEKLKRPTRSVAERAGLIARHVDDRGILFMLLAAVGVIVLAAATAAGQRLGTGSGAIFLVNLLPVGQLMVHGRFETPTREQLLRLYRVLAVRQHRLDQLAAKARAAQAAKTATDPGAGSGVR